MYRQVDGKPHRWINGYKAAESVNIEDEYREYNPMFHYLKRMGWITTLRLIETDKCQLTPEGITAVEDGPPTVTIQQPPYRR